MTESSSLLPPLTLRRVLAFMGALIPLAIFNWFVTFNFWLGEDHQWHSGHAMSGDMIQHYAAGDFWKRGEIESLYRGFHVGDWIMDWNARELKPRSEEAPMTNFNYVYAPLLAAISSWFLSVSFWNWLTIWFHLCMVWYAASYILIKYDLRSPFRLFPFLYFFSFPSFYYAQIPFQNTALTLLLLISSSLIINRGCPFWAGLLFSCAFYKPQFMPYFCFFALLTGQWRFLIGLVTGNILWLLLGILLCGWESHILWFESLRNMASGEQFQRDGLNQSWSGLFRSFSPQPPELPLTLCSHAISLGLLSAAAFIVRWANFRFPWKPGYMLYLAATCWLFASPYTPHYSLLLGLPWWMLFMHAKGTKGWSLPLLTLFWLSSLICISGMIIGKSFNAPFLTLWLFGSLLSVTDLRSIPKNLRKQKLFF